MTTETGRPGNAGARAGREVRVYDLLDSLGIRYTRADHEAADTMEACAEAEKALGTKICKNLFLCNRQKTDFYLLLMPGDKPFRTKDLSAQINTSRLSFAEAGYMLQYLDILPGSVSVLGLMNDTENKVSLLLDGDLLTDTYIGCHPCMNTSTLKIAMKDITGVFLPAVNHSFRTVKLDRS